jgi:hypothetical protein
MKLLNFKNIAIAALVVFVLLQYFNPGGVIPSGKKIKIDGKKYEIIKHTIDTFEVEKIKTVYKKGKDIFHEVILHDTTVRLVNVDTAALLADYFAKVVYKDTLRLPDSLGTIALIDTISKNKIQGRFWDAKVKERLVKETMIVKEPAKAQLYYGINAGFDKKDYVSAVGAGVILKTKKDKLYQVNIGVNNRTTDGTNGSFSPYVGAGAYWKIKLKK